MQLQNILAVFIAGASVVAAAPAAPQSRNLNYLEARAAQACDQGWSFCGECNGTSCKVAGINYGCSIGSCTKQSGGGDGAHCGTHGTLAQGPYECPGNRG
ncbi:hypothetical protein BGZ60DRAFT_528560 [Tricladium varicosporioides]|nr:hypothetical protein BGZ60DRAFT_528560 [Hymenoscyphus varicosporioides]